MMAASKQASSLAGIHEWLGSLPIHVSSVQICSGRVQRVGKVVQQRTENCTLWVPTTVGLRALRKVPERL
jgi:hypothetical protein